ncbi:MAG: CHASE2 domain-containing protein [Cyclobacteriaceae bacterium]|jgi:CHASE2 domain-containing sensor protein|nr:CHASE2 domain-containing protein [Cyclobacteriaceae bacterium]
MKKLSLRGLAITTFVFLMMAGVSKLTDLKLFSAFDGMAEAFKEFEITDIVFSELREQPLVDERIIIVNLGNLPRRDVAQQVHIISQFKPKVIGIDSYFDCEGGLRDSINCPQLLDTLGNLMLANAIQDAGNVVLVSKLLQKAKTDLNQDIIDVYDSLEYSDSIFSVNASYGYANLVTDPPAVNQDDVKQCRSFIPKYTVNNVDEYAFAIKLCMAFDSTKTKRFLARDKEEEIINYRGNVEIQDTRSKSVRQKDTETTRYPLMFYAIDADQLLNGEFFQDFFKDKIVIVGFLGSYFGDVTWSDKYFTPLNKKVAGRANPDMFGVIVHANIVAMILNEDYVDELPEWAQITIALVVCFFTVILFIIIDQRLPMWFDTLSVTIQVFQILITSAIIVFAFQQSSFKLDLSMSLAASALVGPAYDIYKGFENQITAWLTKKPEEVLTE